MRTVAVVGCSAEPSTTSHCIARYLMDAGFGAIPVNPNHVAVLGRMCYPSAEAIPHETVLRRVARARAR